VTIGQIEITHAVRREKGLAGHEKVPRDEGSEGDDDFSNLLPRLHEAVISP
jgi:hypothetical protein